MKKIEPKIILIGGTAGVGKTSLANKLCCYLDIDHRIGTGFIREIAKVFLSRYEYPILHSYTFDAYKYTKSKNIVDGFIEQVKLLKKPIEFCIKRAYNEGTSLIIEGNHIVPGIIDSSLATNFIILQSNENHYNMLNSIIHKNRVVSISQYQKVKIIEDFILKSAMKNNIPILKIENDLESTVKAVIKNICG